MLANTLPLINQQPVAKAPVAAKGLADGLAPGGDTFAREMGLAQARAAAMPKPALAAPATPPTPAAPPARAPTQGQARPEAARPAEGVRESKPRPAAAASEPRPSPGAAVSTPSKVKPGPGGTAGPGKSAPGEPADAATAPAPGADGPLASKSDAGAEPAADLASMIASMLGLDSPAAAASGPAGVAAALGKTDADPSAVVPPATTGDDLTVSTSAAAVAGPEVGTQARDQDAATAGLQSTAELALAGVNSKGQPPAGAELNFDVAGAAGAAEATTTAAPLATAMPANPAPGSPVNPGFNPATSPILGALVTHAGPAPAPFAAQLSAVLGSPEFAPALGHQVSLLIRGGVQEARLHLNPAEMGPITVQIALDGQTAQINLAAEQPLTRQWLEQAMPVLAGALREEGLTLTGGGVFEQARDPRQSDAQAHAEQRATPTGSADDTPAPPAATLRTLRGAVDLIA